MTQFYPIHQLLIPSRQSKNIPQHPNLQLVKVLVHRILHERFKFQRAFLNLKPRLWVYILAIFVLIGFAVLCCVAVVEAKKRRVGGGEACFEGVGTAVEDFVDSVYYVVDERLWRMLVLRFPSFLQ
jgi:hypothetical protein